MRMGQEVAGSSPATAAPFPDAGERSRSEETMTKSAKLEPVDVPQLWAHENIATARLYDQRKSRLEDSPRFKVTY